MTVTTNNKHRQSKGGITRKSDTTKKFTGHDKGDLEGIVLTEDRSITQFTELQDRLQTIGGSKYMPKVGLSIETLKRFNRSSFAPRKPTKEEWTEKKIVEGVKKDVENKELKEVLIDMYKEQVKQSVKDVTTYSRDMKKVYSLALGQIDDGMKEKLKSSDDWERVKTD